MTFYLVHPLILRCTNNRLKEAVAQKYHPILDLLEWFVLKFSKSIENINNGFAIKISNITFNVPVIIITITVYKKTLERPQQQLFY
jgi:hypothetical protein